MVSSTSIPMEPSLKLINDCTYSVKIYFDDAYIGWLSSDKEETWSVPSGNHTVKATCSFANDYEEDFNFIAGVTTTIRLELQKKSGQALALNAVLLSPVRSDPRLFCQIQEFPVQLCSLSDAATKGYVNKHPALTSILLFSIVYPGR